MSATHHCGVALSTVQGCVHNCTKFHNYTDLIEPISFDDVFLDVTENKKGMKLGVDIARETKQCIRETTGQTASAGVSVQVSGKDCLRLMQA